MLGTPFYFSTIRKTVVGIGAMFNNIHLIDTDINGVTVKDTKVPLAYATRQAYWTKLKEEQRGKGSQNATSRVTLPRMSFDMVGLAYDSTRQKHALGKRSAPSSNSNNLLKQLNPVPYDLSFEVKIYVKEVEDGLQIIEQILPTFTPSYNLSLKMIPEMGIVEDVQVSLESVDSEDNYEDGFDTNRIIVWTLGLVAKTHIYQPIKDVASTKETITSMYDNASMTNQLSTLGVAVLPSTATTTDPYTIPTTSTLAPAQQV